MGLMLLVPGQPDGFGVPKSLTFMFFQENRPAHGPGSQAPGAAISHLRGRVLTLGVDCSEPTSGWTS